MLGRIHTLKRKSANDLFNCSSRSWLLREWCYAHTVTPTSTAAFLLLLPEKLARTELWLSSSGVLLYNPDPLQLLSLHLVTAMSVGQRLGVLKHDTLCSGLCNELNRFDQLLNSMTTLGKALRHKRQVR